MTVFTFANNVSTTLAGAISASATSLTLSSAANLPSTIPAGKPIVITLNDRATGQQFEIIYATSVSGATLSGLQRGQEGTTAQSWSTNDFAWSGPTAGQMGSLNPGRLLNVQTFMVAGTTQYVPTPGMAFVIAYCQGAGAGSGGVSATSSGSASISGGASSGALAVGKFTAADIGSFQTITVGAAGTAGAAGNSSGGSGGDSIFGALMRAQGGFPSQGFGPTGTSTGTVLVITGAGAQTHPVATGGNLMNISGAPGSLSIGGANIGGAGGASAVGGLGGGSPLAGGGIGPGAGGGGVAISGATGDTAGNPGLVGAIFVYEFS
ncbi:hypothetical protein [Burkholderia gladioli]|uniref:hypothetical protein n=1 Tax=Burkholderia gladioli TaxID=28095 RepID=UPI0016405B12|nr:hypothetical protein [Burkholderia gladioli]